MTESSLVLANVCRKCGTTNRPDQAICWLCKSSDEGLFVQRLFCSRCGAVNAQGARECQNCRNAVAVSPMPAAGQQRVNHVITVVLVLIFVLILLVGIGLSLHHPGWLILYGLAVAPTFTAILVGVHLGLGGTSSPNGVQVGGAAKSPVGLVLKIVGGALFALMASAVMIVVGFLLAISTLIATINVCLKTLTGAGG